MTRRISRRTFIAGASASAAAVGAAGYVALSGRNGSSSPKPATPLESLPSPTPTTVPTPTAPRPGGSQTITAPGRFNLDTFDAQLTGESSVVEILGRTHSRLVQWADKKLTGDLAQRWETPDAQTLILHLDPGARWQPRAPLNGRALTAEDVVSHLKRSLQIAAGGKAPLAQRYHAYGAIASVDSPAAGQVRIALNQPDPFLLDTLASEFALIQAPEAVERFSAVWSKLDSDHVVGTGPWSFDWANDGVTFTAWLDGHRKPLLDELHVVEPSDAAKRFVDGSLDEAIIRDRRDSSLIPATALRFRRYEPQIVMSSFYAGSPPWNDGNLINAISAAMARPELARRMFGGRAEPSFPVPPSNQAPADGVRAGVGYAGYLDEDTRAGARSAWGAAGGLGLGTITIDFPSVFDPLYSASSIVVAMLNDALGPQFKAGVETYTTISKRIVEGYYGNGRPAFWFGWGAPISSPSAERYVAETYAAGSPGQRATGAPATQVVGDATNIIGAGFLGVVPWLQQFADVVRNPKIQAPEPSPFWNQHLDYLRANV
ncbi:MAG: ABC transporter substrate-binding protein [bacterium]